VAVGLQHGHSLGSKKNAIISDEDQKVNMYLDNLVMLWQLGDVTEEEEEKQERRKLEVEIAAKKAARGGP
jgi:hypothetical protein